MSDERLHNIVKEGSATFFDGSEIFVFGGLEDNKDVSDTAGSSAAADVSLLPSGSLTHGTVGKEEVKKLCSLDQTNAFSTITKIGTKLFVIFGFHPETGWSEDVFMYDLESDSWEMLDLDEDADEIPGPRDKHCAVAVGDEIYVFGGFGPMEDEEGLDESSERPLDTIAEGNETATDGNDKEASSSVEGNGDANCKDNGEETEVKGPSASFSWFNDTWIMTEEEGIAYWSQPLFSTSARPTPRAASTLTLDKRRNRLVNFGGRDYTGRQNDVNIYDIGARKWLLDVVEGGKIPPERSYHAACIHNDRLMVCGGRDNEDKELNDIYMLDLESLIFEKISLSEKLIFQPRCCHAMNVVGDELVIIGGVSGYQPEKMTCENQVEELKSIPWVSLVSHELEEPAKKKPRTSEEQEGQSEVKS